MKKIGGRDLSSYLAIGQIQDQKKPSATEGIYRYETMGLNKNGTEFNGIRKVQIDNEEIIWANDLGSKSGLSPIITNYETVLWKGASNSGRGIHAFNTKNGEKIWFFEHYEQTINMVLGAHFLYVGGQTLKAIDPMTGKFKWEFPLKDWEDPSYIDYGKFYSPVVVGHDETIYGASWRYMYAINGLTGELKWKTKTEAEENSRKWKEFGSQHYSSPLLTDSKIVYLYLWSCGKGKANGTTLQLAGLFSGIYAVDTNSGDT